jgi:hypothetical protein
LSNDYILKIGLATENEAKLGLFEFLKTQYLRQVDFDLDRAAGLAAGVTNKVFGEQPNDEANTAFARDNEKLIEAQAREIARDETLCQLLSGAAYNTCYARFLRAGGKRSMFSNTFLAYVRAGCNPTNRLNRQIIVELGSEILTLNAHILDSMDAMQSLGILRTLPHSPNERLFYDAVHDFANRVGVQFQP